MPEYELRLRFTAANGLQASRLAEAWADTCAAEYGTVYAGLWLAAGSQPSTHPVDLSPVGDIQPNTSTDVCEWCGRAIRQESGVWLAVKGEGTPFPAYCDANDEDRRHEPSSANGT